MTKPTPLLILISGPLTGVLTWAYVANVLWERELDVIVPGLNADSADPRPFWEQQTESVRMALDEFSPEDTVVLVGHGAAGALLPAIGAAIAPGVAAYVFVDAALPRHGASHLDLFEAEEERLLFLTRVKPVDGHPMIPALPAEALRHAIPDDAMRAEFAADLQPFPLAAYKEPIPVPAKWPDAPCAYLSFKESAPAYADSIERARHEQWPYAQLRGGHLLPVVAPEKVAGAIKRLLDAVGVDLTSEVET